MFINKGIMDIEMGIVDVGVIVGVLVVGVIVG